MNVLKIFKILILIFCSQSALGQFQPLGIVAHYPASAFIAKRLLPFSVQGPSTASIKSVVVTDGDGCKAFVDPYHEMIFHLYCSQPTSLSFEVMIDDGSENNKQLSMSSVNISENRLPSEGWGGSEKTSGEGQ